MQTPPFDPSGLLETLTASSLIRRRPDMFFAEGRPTQQALIDRVLDDVADVPECRAKVRREGDWVAIWGDADWMAPGAFVFEELFRHFVPRRSGGLRTDRAEIFVLATAQALLTSGEAGDFAAGLTAAEIPHDLSQAMAGAARTLVWRFAA